MVCRKRYSRKFAFPVEEENAFSKYAVVVNTGKTLELFSEELSVEEAAESILEIINMFERNGIKTTYEKDVKFIFYDEQMKSTSRIMKRLLNNSKLN